MGFLYFIIGIFAFVVICIFGLLYFEKKAVYNEEIKKANEELYKTNNELNNEKQQLTLEYEKLKSLIQEKQNFANELASLTTNMNERAAAAFEQYVDTLETSYKEKEIEFENNIELLDNSYCEAQEQWIKEKDLALDELNKLKSTRAAAMEAQRQEKIIKENKDKFRLNISDSQKHDVITLERVKKELTQPRILSMLIWQTYFRDYMTELCNYILGNKIVCGIYKITNQITDECYIGQSVDIAKRWKDHAKCGLGIDTPVGNKLYKSMQEDSIWNFTFELLEECPREQLNEKERFYIELYQSNEYGFNSTTGNR